METLPTVVLVDDDDTANYLHRRMLLRLRAASQVLVAHSGTEALALLAPDADLRGAPSPALVLLDLNMPGMDGFGFLAAHGQLPSAQRQHAVVVVLTSSANPQDLRRLDALPTAGVLQKPLTAAKVAQALAWYADHTGAEPQTDPGLPVPTPG